MANHSQRLEALLLPCLLAWLRDGRRVHFLADWNFALIPPIGLIYWCGGTILLTRKPARPQLLNVFKPLFTRKETGFARAAQRLAEGACVGVYPEGTVNRRPDCLLRGYPGAARLSLETGVPIVPAGVRFPGYTGHRRIEEQAPFQLTIGAPMAPGAPEPRAPLDRVRDWHAHIMNTVSSLSGKSWSPEALRR